MNAKSGIKLLTAGYLLPAVRGGRIAQGESHADPTVIPAGSHRQFVGYPTVIPETLWDRSHRPGGIPLGSRRLSPLDIGITQKTWAALGASAVRSFASGRVAEPSLCLDFLACDTEEVGAASFCGFQKGALTTHVIDPTRRRSVMQDSAQEQNQSQSSSNSSSLLTRDVWFPYVSRRKS